MSKPTYEELDKLSDGELRKRMREVAKSVTRPVAHKRIKVLIASFRREDCIQIIIEESK